MLPLQRRHRMRWLSTSEGHLHGFLLFGNYSHKVFFAEMVLH